MLLTYFLNDFETVPVAPITTGITLACTFHMRCIFCKVLSAIHIAPYRFSYFICCQSLSLFYLCMFRCILGLVALTVSEWSALRCLVAVTFLSLRSTLLSGTPDVSIPGLQQ
jgi:hypothetical protein